MLAVMEVPPASFNANRIITQVRTTMCNDESERVTGKQLDSHEEYVLQDLLPAMILCIDKISVWQVWFVGIKTLAGDDGSPVNLGEKNSKRMSRDFQHGGVRQRLRLGDTRALSRLKSLVTAHFVQSTRPCGSASR